MKLARKIHWENEFLYWEKETPSSAEQLEVIEPFAVYEDAGRKRWDDDHVERIRNKKIRKFKLHEVRWN